MVRGFRFSLRRYILIALLVMGSVVIGGFSLLAMNNFFEGMDGVMRGTMIHAARSTTVTPGQPQKVLSFILVADWDDFPDNVKQQFDPEQLQPYRLNKYVERDFIFFRPRSAMFVVKVVDRHTQAVSYVAQIFARPRLEGESVYAISHEGWSLLLGLGVLVVFAIMLLIIMRTVTRPVERLRQWAQGLDEKSLANPRPDFQYQELNALAGIVHQSLQHVREGLDREREFVNHASHELRTPIAVIRSSVELLHKLESHVPSQGGNAIQRIDHASHTMTDLTETLLWLGRQDESLVYSDVQPGKLLASLVDDLRYLLVRKQVEVTLQTDDTLLHLPATACRIVLGNLVRNAFQHTQSGQVAIVQQGSTIRIENTESTDTAPEEAVQQLGYGLGLELVARITETLGWEYTQSLSSSGGNVVLELNGHK